MFSIWHPQDMKKIVMNQICDNISVYLLMINVMFIYLAGRVVFKELKSPPFYFLDKF